ncbi:MAG: EscN/YscN/HrcN family type III secretion system ATPase, partial [Candidatus Contendobacter sp.]|nr:EscN/YscN/HrcN family type III secretion system ATPase [Candidatus Contendobacter sp.]
MNAITRTTGFNYITDLLAQSLDEVQLLEIRGRITQITGTIIKAMVPGAKIGELCLLRNPGEGFELKAEVIGFVGKEALLTPMGDLYGLSSNTEVIPTGKMQMVPVGPALLGRVLNGTGEPLDVGVRGPLPVDDYYPVYQDAPDPLSRRIIDQPLALGLRALDGLLTCGEGQRLG